MSISSQISTITSRLPAGVQLIAVSKTHPAEAIHEAYNAGQRLFGESRPQELATKTAALPGDIQWHFIGHLQTNKVKTVIGKAHLIHAVDSERLLLEIEKEAAKQAISASCLLQIHIAQEDAKFGFSPEELATLLQTDILSRIPHVHITGLMGMATNTENEKQIRNEFRSLKQLFDRIKSNFFAGEPAFCELSMGMSGDYSIAIEEGATLIRVGSAIFGER